MTFISIVLGHVDHYKMFYSREIINDVIQSSLMMLYKAHYNITDQLVNYKVLLEEEVGS